MTRPNVLSTKKLETSLLEWAKEQGLAIIEQEAIQVKPILTREKWNEIFSVLEKNVAHAVFTSVNGVLSLKKYLNTYVSHLPVQWKMFCISGRTKELLQENKALFGTVEGTAANGAELAEVILRKGVKEVLFFSGNRRRDELPHMLQAAGVQVHEVVVYETEETPVKTAADVDAVLFFSPSAVQSFFSVNQLKENTVCFAIGHTTAGSIRQFTNNQLVISKEPTQEALLGEVIQYYKNRAGRN